MYTLLCTADQSKSLAFLTPCPYTSQDLSRLTESTLSFIKCDLKGPCTRCVTDSQTTDIRVLSCNYEVQLPAAAMAARRRHGADALGLISSASGAATRDDAGALDRGGGSNGSGHASVRA